MATAKLRQAPVADNATPIQFLHALWERANSIYNVVEEATPTGDDPNSKVKASWFGDATAQVYRQSSFLQLALLNEQPMSMADAVILAGHIHTHGIEIDHTATKYREETFAAQERAQASLFAFLSSQVPLPFEGWLADSLEGAKREVALRTGRPEGWTISEGRNHG